MFTEQTKTKVIETLTLFLKHEQGNRVTIFNIAGLISKVDKDFTESIYIKPKGKNKGV